MTPGSPCCTPRRRQRLASAIPSNNQSRAVWDRMREEIDSIGDRTQQVVLPKSELRKTLNYVNNHWLELTRYIDDPQLPMDNNQCEQLMKQVALRRKNGLFAGSLLGGERNAGFLTLVSSVHRNDLDPWRSMAILGDPWRSLAILGRRPEVVVSRRARLRRSLTSELGPAAPRSDSPLSPRRAKKTQRATAVRKRQTPNQKPTPPTPQLDTSTIALVYAYGHQQICAENSPANSTKATQLCELVRLYVPNASMAHQPISPAILFCSEQTISERICGIIRHRPTTNRQCGTLL